jgi:hypothetical protein
LNADYLRASRQRKAEKIARKRIAGLPLTYHAALMNLAAVPAGSFMLMGPSQSWFSYVDEPERFPCILIQTARGMYRQGLVSFMPMAEGSFLQLTEKGRQEAERVKGW